MKNFQQTVKQRRISMGKQKAAMQQGKPKVFQPTPAWGMKKKIGGVPVDLLNEKQTNAGHMGTESNFNPYFW